MAARKGRETSLLWPSKTAVTIDTLAHTLMDGQYMYIHVHVHVGFLVSSKWRWLPRQSGAPSIILIITTMQLQTSFTPVTHRHCVGGCRSLALIKQISIHCHPRGVITNLSTEIPQDVQVYPHWFRKSCTLEGSGHWFKLASKGSVDQLLSSKNKACSVDIAILKVLYSYSATEWWTCTVSN